MPTRAQLVKWGNSHAVRIPVALVEEAQLKEGEELEITVEGGVISIEKAKPALTLEALVRGIKPDNVHKESQWGHRVGNEQW